MGDSFDLRRLTDFDFESVVHDLLERSWRRKLELFAPGRDLGIDLRHFATRTGSATIVQCKHWPGAEPAALLRHMVKHELPKVRELSPARYVLATSTPLTPLWKQRLIDSFEGFIVGPSDVLGNRELQARLRRHPEIVRRHLRLWLSDATILRSVLHQNVHVRSAALRHDADETMRIYVSE